MPSFGQQLTRALKNKDLSWSAWKKKTAIDWPVAQRALILESAQCNRWDWVHALMEEGALLELRKDWADVLYLSARAGDLKAVKWVLSQKESHLFWGEDGYPLIWACEMGCHEVVDHLLEQMLTLPPDIQRQLNQVVQSIDLNIYVSSWFHLENNPHQKIIQTLEAYKIHVERKALDEVIEGLQTPVQKQPLKL